MNDTKTAAIHIDNAEPRPPIPGGIPGSAGGQRAAVRPYNYHPARVENQLLIPRQGAISDCALL